MEILRRTPWSRTKGQRVNKEFLEIVGNGKPTGSALKDTIAVSDTTWISVEKLHHQIRLRVLSCSRMREKHREPEVPEAEAQVWKWLDFRARITSKELAQLHSVKNGILQSACSTSQKMAANLGISALTHMARLTKSLARSLKRMVTKLQKLLKNKRQLSCVFQDMEPPKSSSISRKSLSQSDVFDSLKPLCVTQTFETKIHRLEWFAQVILISVTPMLQNLRIGLRKRRSGKIDVPVKQRGGWLQASSKIKGEK